MLCCVACSAARKHAANSTMCDTTVMCCLEAERCDMVRVGLKTCCSTGVAETHVGLVVVISSKVRTYKGGVIVIRPKGRTACEKSGCNQLQFRTKHCGAKHRALR